MIYTHVIMIIIVNSYWAFTTFQVFPAKLSYKKKSLTQGVLFVRGTLLGLVFLLVQYSCPPLPPHRRSNLTKPSGLPLDLPAYSPLLYGEVAGETVFLLRETCRCPALPVLGELNYLRVKYLGTPRGSTFKACVPIQLLSVMLAMIWLLSLCQPGLVNLAREGY